MGGGNERISSKWVESESASVDAKAVLDDIESSRAQSTSLDIDSDAFHLHLDDTDFLSLRNADVSLAEVHFGESDDEESSQDTHGDPSISSLRKNLDNLQIPTISPTKPEKRTLYLQMEYLAGRTLREVRNC